MLPRAIARLPGSGFRSRPLSTHKDFCSWGRAASAPLSPPQKHADGCSGRQQPLHTSRCSSSSTAVRRADGTFASQPAAIPTPLTYTAGGKRRRSKASAQHRLSTGPAPFLAQEGEDEVDSSGLDESGHKLEIVAPPAAAGLRPETAAASTPVDLGCKAYYMARNIDIKTVCKRLYAGFPRSFEKHCVVIGPLDPNCFEGGYPRPRDPSGGLDQVLRDLSKKGSKTPEDSGPRPFDAPPAFTVDSPAYQARAWDMWEPGGTSRSDQRGGFGNGRARDAGNSYVVLFDYGSVIFLHFNQHQQEAHLKRQRDFLYGENEIPPEGVKTETHGVVLWSTLPEPARLEPDCTTLRELDVNHITIIGTVLGQTVALDHYGDQVDSMMDKFVAINSGVEKTGKFTDAQKKELFQLVARNNTVRTDVISKLGVLERSEAAWKDKDYNYVWEGLREEFEMDNRLRTIESKLNMLQQNTNFFIEMLHNQKSTMLEWTIIVLIAAEIVVGVCDLLNLKPFPT